MFFTRNIEEFVWYISSPDRFKFEFPFYIRSDTKTIAMVLCPTFQVSVTTVIPDKVLVKGSSSSELTRKPVNLILILIVIKLG